MVLQDNWDDDEVNKDKPATDTGPLPAKKKKKKLADIIAEKEASDMIFFYSGIQFSEY